MSSIVVAGDTSGTITIAAPAVAGSGTLTLPVATDTLAGIAATQTLTNKTLGTGTVFPAGAVLQVVSASYSVETTNSTITPADTGLTASITPKFITSKILAIVNQAGVEKSDANSQNAVNVFLQKNGSNLIKLGGYTAFTNTALRIIAGTVSCAYLDSPATISAITYKTQFYNAGANAASVAVQSQNAVSTITLMEIAG